MNNTAGAGMVLRDHEGAVIFAACRAFFHWEDALEAELAVLEEGGVKMANIQQQPERPRMDHILLEALTNRNAFGILQLVNPADLPAAMADQIAVPMPYQEAPENALQGVTSDGDGVLHIAARFEDVELVRAIFIRWRNAVDVTAKNKRGETALHCAAATGNDAMIDLLIRLAGAGDKKRQLLTEQNNNGETCLHEAVRFGNRYALQRLVEQNVDAYNVLDHSPALVEVHDKEGISPLYLATTLRQLEIVRCLTEERGVYPAPSYDGPGSKTALHAAVLLSKDLSEHLASWNNKELIGKADVHGSTPLHLLASTKHEIIMKLLLDLDPSAGYQADDDGSLPIHVAAANGRVKIVKLLFERRPSCAWSCNNLGQTIIHIAVQKRKQDVVKYVCSEQSFAPIFNITDTDGNTALHLAVLQGDQLTFCRLIKGRELCLSFTNKEDRTPLDLAQLSIPPGIFILKGPRHWIKYTLVLAGADYGVRRHDHLATDVAEVDKEKESEYIGKSAGLVAVCVVLILTTSFAAPFSVTNLYRNPKKDITRAAGYNMFVMSDAFAFSFSAVAITCSTLAGLSFADQRMRLSVLGIGAAALCAAALFIIFVFTAGMYVTVGPVAHLDNLFRVILFFMAYPFILALLMTILRSALLHGRALISRLGFTAWCGATTNRKGFLGAIMFMWVAAGGGLLILEFAIYPAREMRDQAQAPSQFSHY